MPHLNPQEERFVHWLSERFERTGGQFVNRNDAVHELQLPSDAYEPLIRRMESLGILRSECSTVSEYAPRFSINGDAVELSRELRSEAEQRPDLVDQVLQRFRRNPYTAWMVAMLLALAFLLVLADSALSVAEKLGWLTPRHAQPVTKPAP